VRPLFSSRLLLIPAVGEERMTTKIGGVEGGEVGSRTEETSPGIVVTDCQSSLAGDGDHPRIAAFIWGGKVRPAPTLPFGKWKGAA